MPMGVYDHSKRKKQFCPNGHDTFIVGRDSTGYCRECARESIRKWAKTNPEKAKKWNKEHPEETKLFVTNWRKNNIEKARKAVQDWSKNHPEKHNENNKRWAKANPGKIAQLSIKHQTNRNLRVPKWGQAGIEEFYNNCPDDYEVDHIIPLQGKNVSGLHVITNLQYLTRHENRVKSNKTGDKVWQR